MHVILASVLCHMYKFSDIFIHSSINCLFFYPLLDYKHFPVLLKCFHKHKFNVCIMLPLFMHYI